MPPAEQRSYYQRTANEYDSRHVHGSDDHAKALRILFAWLPLIDARTIIDIGAGTGRAQRLAAELGVPCNIIGIEPVDALRRQGHAAGIPEDRLINGDGSALTYEDDEFDLAIESGVLHHLADPGQCVREMCRVARRGVFLSDSNNRGQGTMLARLVKHGLWQIGLWPLTNYIKTKGKGFTESEGDGIAFSYSIFDSLPIIRTKFTRIYMFSTAPVRSGWLPFSAGQMAILAVT